jgi:hypothetical protein
MARKPFSADGGELRELNFLSRSKEGTMKPDVP